MGFPGGSNFGKESTCNAGLQETGVQSLGQEDPLKEEMATQSRILAWRIPWTEEPGGQQSMGLQELDTTERLSINIQMYKINSIQLE